MPNDNDGLLLIRSAFEKRSGIAGADTDAYRLFNSGGDGCDGLIIDRYGEFCLLQFFRDVMPVSCEQIVQTVLSAQDLLGFSPRGILLKRRMKSSCDDPQTDYISEHVYGELPPQNMTVRQNGIVVNTDLIRGMNTGLFLDMRSVRTKMEAIYAAEHPSRVLNLFCYTGAFSVHAIRHGASSCINVDTSRTVLNRASDNYLLNGVTPPSRDFVCMDSGEYLRYAAKKGIHADLVIFDPPTFSRSKKGSFNVTRDYPEYLSQIGKVADGGLVLSVINTHSVSDDEYFSLHPGLWENIFFEHEADDFPADGDPYLKAGLWRCKNCS